MTAPIHTSILEKLRKLLSKAKGTNNENEAKAFFAKASELMTKHGIEQHEIDQHAGEKEKVPEFEQINLGVRATKTERPPHPQVRRVIRHCFNVFIIRVRGWDNLRGMVYTYYMIGTKQDCTFAAYAFEVLSETFRRCWNEFSRVNFGGERAPATVWNGYLEGLVSGFNAAWDEAQARVVKEAKAQSYALMIIDKSQALEKFVDSRKDIKSSTRHCQGMSAEAFQQGYFKGRMIKVNLPLHS
jgi:hypothetical protein